MPTTYGFYADAFGPALAELAIEEGGELTDDLRQRAEAGWNMPHSALRAVFARCGEILAAEEA